MQLGASLECGALAPLCYLLVLSNTKAVPRHRTPRRRKASPRRLSVRLLFMPLERKLDQNFKQPRKRQS